MRPAPWALAAVLALPAAGSLAQALGAAPGLADAECVACRAVLAELRGTLEASAWQALLGGEIVTREEATAPGEAPDAATLPALGVVRGTPEQVWSVLTDWASYPSFLPNAVETRLLRLEARRAWLSQHLRIFWTDIRYGAVWDLEPERGVLSFALDPDVPHDIAGTKGTWRLAPLEDGRWTLLRYDLWVDPGRALPEFVERALTRRSLPGVLRSVRAEVERRFPAGESPR